MAQFDSFVKTPDSPTIFGTRQGAPSVAFQTPDQFTSVGGAQDFSNVVTDANFSLEGSILFPDYQQSLAQPTPINLDVQPQIPQEIMTSEPVTTAQISQQLLAGQEKQAKQTETFLTQMAEFQKLTLEAIKPTEQETQIQFDISDITNQARQLRTAFKAGVTGIEGQSIPLSLAYGQTRQLEAQANQRLESLANSQAPLIDNLKALQSAREVKLSQLSILRDFASQNFQLLSQNAKEAQDLNFKIFQLQQEEQRYQKQEQQAAKQQAIELGITTPMHEVGGIIYDTATGEARYRQVGQEIQSLDGSIKFSKPEEFFAHSGLSSFDQITKVKAEDELDQPLSLAEAKSYGVPFGTTYRDMIGRTPIETPKSGDDEIVTDFSTASKNLQNQRIPATMLNKDTSLSINYRRKLLTEGLSDEIITWLWEAIIDGNSFEDIRNEIRNNGADPIILDTFVQTLQA